MSELRGCLNLQENIEPIRNQTSLTRQSYLLRSLYRSISWKYSKRLALLRDPRLRNNYRNGQHTCRLVKSDQVPARSAGSICLEVSGVARPSYPKSRSYRCTLVSYLMLKLRATHRLRLNSSRSVSACNRKRALATSPVPKSEHLRF
jgi:hypothetical protein